MSQPDPEYIYSKLFRDPLLGWEGRVRCTAETGDMLDNLMRTDMCFVRDYRLLMVALLESQKKDPKVSAADVVMAMASFLKHNVDVIMEFTHNADVTLCNKDGAPISPMDGVL